MFNDYGSVGGLGALVVFGAIFSIIFFLVAVAFYIFLSLALYKLAQRRGIEMAWLAWIPIAQMYIVGLMVKKVNVSTFEIPKLEIVLPVSMLVTYNFIQFIQSICSRKSNDLYIVKHFGCHNSVPALWFS
jgi:hypothetical protein